MAKIESILGKVTGTIGSMTFRHQSGTRSIISSKANQVSNPKTVAQNNQRMKIRPAQLFYNAFESVLNHSRQGVKIGNDHRKAFMSEVLKNTFTGVPYVVKGTPYWVPGRYPMSKGTLLGPSATGFKKDAQTNKQSVVVNLMTGDGDNTIGEWSQTVLGENPMLQEGDEICAIFAILDHSGEKFYPLIGYIVLDTKDESPLDIPSFEVEAAGADGTYFTPKMYNANDVLTGGCIIISRKVGENKWIYTQTEMLLTAEFAAEAYSIERYQATVDSYADANANAINSPYILQQSSNQPFNGKVYLFTFKNNNMQWEYMAGARFTDVISPSQNVRTATLVFTTDGTENGTLIGNDGKPLLNPFDDDHPEFKPADTGYGWSRFVKWEPEYIEQVVR